MPGLKIGYLPQEPQLEPEQTVREAVEQGIGGVLAAKKRLDEVYAEYAEPDADFDKLAAEQAELEAIIAAAGSENTDLQLEMAADALRLPPWDAEDRRALGRREAPRRAVPAAAVQARHAAARRADQPPRRRERRVARAFPAALSRHRGGDHPRPLLPRQRRRVDPRARPRLGHPLEGQLLRLAGPEGKAPGGRAEDRRRAHEGDEGGAQVGALQRQGAPDQEQGAAGALRGTERRRIPEAQRDQRDLHPGGRAPGQRGHRVQGRHQVLRRPPADRQPELQGAAGRHRRHHRPQRRRQVDAVPHAAGRARSPIRAR